MTSIQISHAVQLDTDAYQISSTESVPTVASGALLFSAISTANTGNTHNHDPSSNLFIQNVF